LPSDLTAGGQGAPTIVISSGGIETTQAVGSQVAAVTSYGALPSGEVVNRGALPLPSNSTRVATIQFGNGSDALDANDRKILSDVVRLQQQSNGVIRVVGHASQRTQNMEPSQHALTNLRVSERRANKVAQILTQMGVSSDQVLVAAVGDNEPVFLEVMPSGEAGNRRAEIYLSN
jgi:outer membrane protein OmpA-like peptidoglycan-associated protein